MRVKYWLTAVAVAMAATISQASTIPVDFLRTPIAVEGTGSVTSAADSVSATLTENADGTITFSMTNLTTVDMITAVFFGGRELNEFGSSDGSKKYTWLSHRFGQAFGEKGVRFQDLKVWANKTVSVTTRLTAGLGLGDFADNAIGVMLVEKRTPNLSIFSGEAEVPLAQSSTPPVLSSMPLPGGVVLLGSGLFLLAARRKTRA